MSKFVSSLLQKIFQVEESTAIAWLQRRKLLVAIVFVIIVALLAYTKWPGIIGSVVNLVFSSTSDWLGWLLLVWLSALTLYVHRRDRTAADRVFTENFKHGLEKWDYRGGWRTERENNQYILIVTNSDAGGIAKPCRLWNDYVFEFETKIVQSNSSWIVRASDILNYVMLQCNPTNITPHFRVNGLWIVLDPVALAEELPPNEWFRVKISVSGARVVVKITCSGKEATVFDRLLLQPGSVSGMIAQGQSTQDVNLFLSFPLGSVGFRESGNSECAHFRDVRVTRIG